MADERLVEAIRDWHQSTRGAELSDKSAASEAERPAVRSSEAKNQHPPRHRHGASQFLFQFEAESSLKLIKFGTVSRTAK